ncbi:hypothetical protein RA26_17895 [Leisingera sp. ANG-M7]|nr:hypothetical protein RA26_17895 [Leisingera sp. ANG-M7]
MNDFAIKNACHKIEPAEWAEVVSSYERRPVAAPAAPFRDIEFNIEFPFPVSADDTLLLGAYSVGRTIDQWFHDGPPPRDGRIAARLAVPDPDAAEEYWLWVELIRPGKSMTCGWSMEERFDLPAPPHATQWRLELLPDRIPTGDGGSRRTRISPL